MHQNPWLRGRTTEDIRTAKPHKIKENRHTDTLNTVLKLHVEHHSSQKDRQLYICDICKNHKHWLCGFFKMIIVVNLFWLGVFFKVVQVLPMKDYSVYIYFEDGKIVCYDMSQMIEKEAFYLLKDIDIFMETCTVLNDILAWDIDRNRDNTTCLDIDPETLYELPFVSEKIA